MSTEQTTKFDWMKWIVIFVLLVAGLFANFHYTQEPLPLKIAAWIILVIVVLLVASRTMRGRKIWRFIKEARNEVRRVVWPNRQETLQMTLLVFAMVFVLSLVLWGVDSILVMALGWFTGSGS